MNKKSFILLTIILIETAIIFNFIFWDIGTLKLTSFFTQILKKPVFFNKTIFNETSSPEPMMFLDLSNNPKIVNALIPNFEQEYDGYVEKIDRVTRVKINSDGFRDREYPVDKPENTYRIVVLGDSITFGMGIELNETFGKILENKLNAFKRGKVYEVMNLAVPSYNTLEEIEFFKDVGLKYNPDMVIIGFFLNDFEDNFEIKERILRSMNSSNATNMSKEEYEFEINNLLGQTATDYYNEIYDNETLFNLHWKKIVAEPLSELSILSKTYNFTVIIVMLESDPRQKALLNGITNQYDWQSVDVWQTLSKYPYSELSVGKLDAHYNYFAHNLIASDLYEFLISKNIIN